MRRIAALLRSRKLSSAAILTLTLLVAWLMLLTPAGDVAERAVSPLRFSVVDRQASGDLVVVEMDAQSAAAIRRWPWSRENYAQLVDQLRQSGARSIVFDVDFSSPSDPQADLQFSQALARAEGLVVLPTFAQDASSGDRRALDALPIPALRRHAALASVSVAPDPDGQVRAMPFGTITAGTPRPSLSAYIAHRSGAANEHFPIDFAIDPATIPRLSFVDVRDGRFDPAMFRGRDVLIGATAIEMGDRYATPRWGVLPGVIVQAIAAETLMRGVPREGSAALLAILALAATSLLIRVKTPRAIGAVGLSGFILIAGIALTAQHLFLLILPVASALAAFAAATFACCVREAIRRFKRQRIVDELTGLPNRAALLEQLAGAQDIAIVAARITEYDKLLATLGQSGTAELVNRIRDRISVLGGGVTVYRIDDRVLAWKATVDASQVSTRADQLRAIMLSPITVGERSVDVSLALGFAQGSDGRLAETVGHAALAADLARSNAAGWHVHKEVDAASAETELSLISDLERALIDGDVGVVYQPKLDLTSGRIGSAEALVRWTHRTRGPLRPDYFIPIVEKANRIGGLTLFVLQRAIEDMTGWRSQGREVRVAINLSAVLFEDPEFTAALAELMNRQDVVLRRLIFEVTESAAMVAPERVAAALTYFKSLGISISVDDYGTGQSTLTYLKKLPLDELKIDRSFVEFAHQNRSDSVLVRSTIDMAHELGLKVVAEGVETVECLEFLRRSGCDMAQGYLISRPIDAVAFAAFLQLRQEEAA